tara:strand:- start:4482 stop:5441 length:960 start_codon:yes stop_codon:yes gene_type:complete
MKSKKILVLGGSGFIGINVIKNLSKNNKNICGTFFKNKPKNINKNVIWKKIDLRKNNLKKFFEKFDTIINCAATTSGSKDITSQPYIHVTDNAIMNAKILQAAYDAKIKNFIFLSCTVMYQSDSKKGIKESDFKDYNQIHNKYFGVASTKLYIEKLCEFYSNISNIKFTIIRHSNIYGPNDKFDLEKSHFFGATITKVLTAKNEIVVWGNGEEKRDLLYIDDLIEFIILSLRKQKNNFRIYNCGLGKNYTINSIVKKIIQLSKKKIKIKNDLTKPNINTSLFLDCSLAKKELGWKPRTKINSGIIKTIKWWKANKNAIL